MKYRVISYRNGEGVRYVRLDSMEADWDHLIDLKRDCFLDWFPDVRLPSGGGPVEVELTMIPVGETEPSHPRKINGLTMSEAEEFRAAIIQLQVKFDEMELTARARISPRQLYQASAITGLASSAEHYSILEVSEQAECIANDMIARDRTRAEALKKEEEPGDGE